MDVHNLTANFLFIKKTIFIVFSDFNLVIKITKKSFFFIVSFRLGIKCLKDSTNSKYESKVLQTWFKNYFSKKISLFKLT